MLCESVEQLVAMVLLQSLVIRDEQAHEADVIHTNAQHSFKGPSRVSDYDTD